MWKRYIRVGAQVLREDSGVLAAAVRWQTKTQHFAGFMLDNYLPNLVANFDVQTALPLIEPWRRRAILACAIEIGFTLASFPLGAFRGSIAKLSAIINAVLLIAACIGLYASASLSIPWLTAVSATIRLVRLVGMHGSNQVICSM